LASAQWLNGLGGKKQQPKGMDDWHQHDGSMASAAKSNNQESLGTYQHHKLQSKRLEGGATSPDWLWQLSHYKHN
jgi:hypothetical protein